MPESGHKALIVGGLGVTGRAVLGELERQSNWEIVALSRRTPDFDTRARFVSVDLLDRRDAEAKLSAIEDVTHIFYCGLSGGVEAENVEGNLALAANSIGIVAPRAKRLERVVFTQGGKYYGCQIGPHRTPSKETDPRHLPPNFYYDQQDLVVKLQEGQDWTYTFVRPEAVIGFSRGGGLLNTGSFLAVYAVICRELGVPFHFPGSEGAFRAINRFTDAGLLARFERWCATQPQCANQAFNITNESLFRFENLWPVFADYFGLPMGRVLTFSLDTYMGDKDALWDRIVEKHGLERTRMSELANWRFADWVMGRSWDTILEDTKRLRYGFHEVVDSEEMFIAHFDRLKAANIIPN